MGQKSLSNSFFNRNWFVIYEILVEYCKLFKLK